MITAHPDDLISLAAKKDNIREWRAVIKGPPSSPFEGHDFLLRLDVSPEYPLTPPAVRFVTKCFHPNINFHTGEICMDILKSKEWSPAWTLQSACRAVQSLLADPNSEVSNCNFCVSLSSLLLLFGDFITVAIELRRWKYDKSWRYASLYIRR